MITNRPRKNIDSALEREKPTPGSLVKVAVLGKALLNPERGDNYTLWREIYNNNTYKALFIEAAESVGKEHWITLQASDDCVFYTYPNPTMFVNNLFSLSRTLVPNWEEIKAILIACQLPGKSTLYTEHGYSLIAPKPLIEEDIQKILAKYDQSHYRHAPTQAPNCLNMHLLAGFITALGAAAVAIAFTLLSGTVATVTAVSGIAAILTGVGLFAFGCSQPGSAVEKPTVSPGA